MAGTLADTTKSTQPRVARGRPVQVAATLCRRELVRFMRQRQRVFGAIGQPAVFWILFGAGLGPSFRLPGDQVTDLSYREYFFPGTVILILLFTAIFTTISIIEDRREGFLQSVLVAPIPRWSMVLGKLTGGALLALAQALIFLVLGLALGISFSLVSMVAMVVFLFAVALGLTGLGFVFAWRLDSSQGYHAVMSVVLLPMWLLSGAFFPAQSGPLQWLLVINPLGYAVAGLRRLLYLNVADAPLPDGLPSATTCWIVTLVFAGAMFALSTMVASQRTKGDLL